MEGVAPLACRLEVRTGYLDEKWATQKDSTSELGSSRLVPWPGLRQLAHMSEKLSLVLYLQRPAGSGVHLDGFNKALRIQRLEGSRPDGRLCTLNGVTQVQRFAQVTDAGMVRIHRSVVLNVAHIV